MNISTRMLRLTLEHFQLLSDLENPNAYDKEIGRQDILKATVEVADMHHLLTILQAFINASQPHVSYRKIDPKELK